MPAACAFRTACPRPLAERRETGGGDRRPTGARGHPAHVLARRVRSPADRTAHRIHSLDPRKALEFPELSPIDTGGCERGGEPSNSPCQNLSVRVSTAVRPDNGGAIVGPERIMSGLSLILQ